MTLDPRRELASQRATVAGDEGLYAVARRIALVEDDTGRAQRTQGYSTRIPDGSERGSLIQYDPASHIITLAGQGYESSHSLPFWGQTAASIPVGWTTVSVPIVGPPSGGFTQYGVWAEVAGAAGASITGKHVMGYSTANVDVAIASSIAQSVYVFALLLVR